MRDEFSNYKIVNKMKKMQQNCEGCKYFLSIPCCNYIIATGKRRPCPPGDKCTVKEIGPAPRVELDISSTEEYDEHEMYLMDLYKRR